MAINAIVAEVDDQETAESKRRGHGGASRYYQPSRNYYSGYSGYSKGYRYPNAPSSYSYSSAYNYPTTYNRGYNQAYQGYNVWNNPGYDNRYNLGYNGGYNLGYNRGYNNFQHYY